MDHNQDSQNQESKMKMIECNIRSFLLDFGHLSKTCVVLAQCPLSRVFTDEIDCLLKALANLENYSTNCCDEYLKALKRYASDLQDIKLKFDNLKLMVSKDVSGAAAELNTHISSISLDEDEKDYDDDYNMDSKNQEVEEFNVSDDSLTFCNKIISRFESRLFGKGEISIDQEVEELIFKSRNRERLAVMYEGWMPWI